MGRKYKIRDQQGLHFVTFTVVNWIDLFTRDEYKELFTDALKFGQKEKGLVVHAYCFMTNHIHLILCAKEGFDLSNIIRDLKRHTSFSLRKAVQANQKESRKEWMLHAFKNAAEQNSRNTQYQIWQQHNHPIHLTNDKMMDQRLDYIHMNPVVAGFVKDPNDWIWSSCRSYELGEDGIVPIENVYA